ncbi:hypothetical protein IVB46_11605 [Bradyrhizobium sp. 61]|uniref:hypothetical protein n=1 Tax=unclassified Bradyrhizobium TaxID=2631580 RepID=UPI001FFA5FEB|nr:MULTISPECIES: hypothetical protein [unclassified Bradyrhizobium]MCK1275877.1 hypothetical protein [Bradyrhizobium sp. 61]MCK1443113.1 hypothetical protein [Bradyrhizobium sp. 48]MCK1460581.1 hypothetical protein [Bradyrhizobium sp. 2]
MPVIAAAMAHPGIVLRRVGSSSAFKEHAELPSAAALDTQPPRKENGKAKKRTSAKPSKRNEKSEREVAAKYEKEERQREKQRAKEEAEAAKARDKRRRLTILPIVGSRGLGGDDDGAGFSHLPFE